MRSGWPSNAVRVAIFYARCHRQPSMRNSSIPYFIDEQSVLQLPLLTVSFPRNNLGSQWTVCPLRLLITCAAIPESSGCWLRVWYWCSRTLVAAVPIYTFGHVPIYTKFLKKDFILHSHDRKCLNFFDRRVRLRSQ